MVSQPRIESVTASAFRIPTETPEADGTLAWDSTTLVVAEVSAAGETGLGFTYADKSAAVLIGGKLAQAITGIDAFAIPAAMAAMLREIRNLGRPGIVATAISAVDTALWDLKGKLLGQPTVSLLGAMREAVPVYGSGGFTTYSTHRLREQFGGWASDGYRWVKMKIGSDPANDARRVAEARGAIGKTELFVDANGAYERKQALRMAERFSDLDVTYFEEPVSSDDLAGLRQLRDFGPAGMRIAAGEYGYDLFYFRTMLEAKAVDILQADASRCLGISGFLRVDALCDAHALPLSAHCAPSLHLHAALAATRLWNQEWFYDHARIEHMLFDGAPQPKDGLIRADLTRPGLGLALKRADAARYEI